MLKQAEADKIISSWIDYARSRNQQEYTRMFWTMRDYIGGGLSDEHYRQHAAEVSKFMESLDGSKEQVQGITEYMKIIVDRYV